MVYRCPAGITLGTPDAPRRGGGYIYTYVKKKRGLTKRGGGYAALLRVGIYIYIYISATALVATA